MTTTQQENHEVVVAARAPIMWLAALLGIGLAVAGVAVARRARH
jgi:ABC-type Fe3+-siderophore transport system permease subunit